MFETNQDDQAVQLNNLTQDVMASELTLTHFASRQGKQSPLYVNTLQDFATAWHALKATRRADEFVRDVI